MSIFSEKLGSELHVKSMSLGDDDYVALVGFNYKRAGTSIQKMYSDLLPRIKSPQVLRL